MISRILNDYYYDNGVVRHARPRYNKNPEYCRERGDEVASRLIGAGYRAMRVGGKTLYIHRAVWVLCKGEWPTHQIDHIDGDKLNNKIENLREVSQRLNLANTKAKGASQYKGVSFNAERELWQVAVDGKYVGRFSDEVEAARAYDRRAMEVFGEYARLNNV